MLALVIRLLTLIIVLSCGSSVHAGSPATNVVTLNESTNIYLQPYLRLWIPDQTIDFASASDPANEGRYSPVTDNSVPVSGRDVWYRFTVKPEAMWGYRGVLDLNDILFEDAEVFIQTPQGLFSSLSGLSHPYNSRLLKNRFIAVPLTLAAEKTSEVFIRIKPLTGIKISFNPALMSDVIFHTNSSSSAQVASLVSGGMIALLIFMFLVANLILQGRVLVMFLGFAASVTLLHLSHAGYITVWLDMPAINYRILFVMLPAMMNVLSLFYCRYLFDMRTTMPVMNRIVGPFSVLYILLLIPAAIAPAEWVSTTMITLKSSASGIASFLVLLFGLRALQLNIKGSGYYLLGVFLFVVMVNITRLPGYGIGNFTDQTRTFVSFGALTLMFCFAIATLQKIRLIAEREKLLEKQAAILENQSRVRTDFLISMSHEIRTPINGVLGMVQMLEKTRLDTGQRYYLDILANAGRTLLNVVNEILDISKLEAGKLEVESIYFDLDKILNFTAKMFGQLNRKPGVHFHYENDFNLPVHVYGDPARLQQVLNNFLSNAFKFTETGQVTLKAKLIDRISDDRVLIRIEVEDNGIGIPEEALNRLFTPFEQADKTTARRFGGSGLGLAISKKIVELMGGKVHVTSSEGKGSRFWADIPFNIAQREEQRYQKMTASLKGKRIAMVMQYPEFNSIYISTLQTWGATCEIIKPEASADSIDWNKIDVFYISDMLPVVELQHWLDAAKENNCPVMLVDGYGENYQPNDFTDSVKFRRLRQPISKTRLADLLYQITHNIFINEDEGSSLPNSRNIMNLNLLVAEDNDVNTKVLQAVFAKNNINAEFVVNGAEAVERYSAAKNNFDAILMDCEMPVMNGFDATRKIREIENQRQLKPIPIIALTAHALLETRDACLQCGMDDILTKPVSFPALLSRLESIEQQATKS